MNFFQEAQKLTDAATDFVQDGTNHLTRSLEDAEATLNQLNQTIDWVGKTTEEFAASGLSKAEELRQQAIETAQVRSLEVGIAGATIAHSLKDLPRTAAELAQEMPKIAYRLQNRAGLRTGDAPRSDADVMALFDKIPGAAKLGADEQKIREFLSDKHGSHVIPRSQGGSNGADNILWEVGSDNLQRGASVMTGSEQIYIRFYNAIDAIVTNSSTIAKLGLTATGTAVLTQAVITGVSYALDLYRGDITIEEFRDRILEAALTAGIATPIFFLVFIAVIALFPELAVLLSVPIVVAGFKAMFGIGIALPLFQSVIRHLEAGGFGEEAKLGYQNLIAEF